MGYGPGAWRGLSQLQRNFIVEMAEGERKEDARPAALDIFCPDDPAVRLNDGAHYGKAQPAAAGISLT